MIPRFGPAPCHDRRYEHRAGVYAILPRDGAVLLTHQALPDDEIQLPGGGIDPGESPIRALHREVFEETGWRIAAPRRFGAFRRFVFMPDYGKWAEKLCIIYVARPVRALGPPAESGHTALWAGAETAARVLGNSGDRHFLKAYLHRL